MTFKPGDVVRITEAFPNPRYREHVGALMETTSEYHYKRVAHPDMPFGVPVLGTEIEPINDGFVNVTTSKTIWVTLPGDDASHSLSEEDANRLIRELELAVA